MMSNFSVFWEGLGYHKFFLVALGVCFLLHVIAIIYRSAILLSKSKNQASNEEEGVSLIITCSNKAETLKENLEAFLTQDYAPYEVIVVDECSEDDTQDVLADLQAKYPHLRTSRIFPETKFRRTKKIAINIGVLAARYDILLFSEINCVPASKNWVRTMQAYFSPDTAVVIGYANYAAGMQRGGLRRYFRFLWFWKAMVLLKNGVHVMGNGFNMGYRKKFYIEKRGFSRNTQEYIGYDTEMVDDLSKKGKVKVVKEPDGRIVITDNGEKSWKDDYSYYYATKRRWPYSVRLWSNLDFIIETLAYLLCVYFIFTRALGHYVLVPILSIFLTDFILINVCLGHLREGKLFITSFTVNLIGFIYKWYYSLYSLFTGKKWK